MTSYCTCVWPQAHLVLKEKNILVKHNLKTAKVEGEVQVGARRIDKNTSAKLFSI